MGRTWGGEGGYGGNFNPSMRPLCMDMSSSFATVIDSIPSFTPPPLFSPPPSPPLWIPQNAHFGRGHFCFSGLGKGVGVGEEARG